MMRIFVILLAAICLLMGGCHSAKNVAANPDPVDEKGAVAVEKADTAQKKSKRKRRTTYRQTPKAENMEELTRRAEKGDTTAQDKLGVIYLKGEKVEKNVDKAIEWWTKAAENGSATAQYKLGVCYQFGFGVKRNHTRARYWYEKAAPRHASAKAALTTLEE
ncbi:MAG: tetratricopeptide repeat protein [Sodaliphilus sp.]